MYEPTDDNVFEVVGIDLNKWKYFYPDDQEIIPRHILETLDKHVIIKSYVDSNHAGNMANRRSYSGINDSPIIWYGKLQNTVEASSFGSEFFFLMIATEIIEALRYKLRCFGVPVEGLAELFCGKKSVVDNLIIPTLVLNKRHNYICYHRLREARAEGVLRVGWIPGEFNPEYLFTNTTMPGNTRHNMVESIFSNISSPIGGIEKV